jgi:hypothetical protein
MYLHVGGAQWRGLIMCDVEAEEPEAVLDQVEQHMPGAPVLASTAHPAA